MRKAKKILISLLIVSFLFSYVGEFAPIALHAREQHEQNVVFD